MDQDAKDAANKAADEAMKNNDGPTVAEMADQAAAAKREAEEASKKVNEMNTKMKEVENEENIEKYKDGK